MKRYSKHLMAVVLAVGLLAVGLVTGPATAGANGSTRIDTCSNQGGHNKVLCVGTINGNTINIEIDNIRVLSPTELSILTLNLTNVVVNAANIGDIQVRVDNVASNTVIVLKDVLNIQVCQVKVIEVGVVNKNIAKCSN